MATTPTPEEKLFAVIQGAPHPPIRSPRQPMSLRAFRDKWSTIVSAIELPRVNQVLLVLIGVLIFSLLLQPLTGPRVSQVEAQAQLQVTPFIIAPPLEGVRALDETLKLVQERDPFRIEETKTTSATTPSEPTESQAHASIQTVLADLKLVGIALGDQPTAMIEQQSTKQTHFLTINAAIGPFTVKEILSDRVILHAGEKDYELL